MSQIEVISYLHRFVHVPYLTESRSRIVTVTRIVDHSAFYHHEEFLMTRLQERNSNTHDLSERQVAFFAVDGIGQVTAMLRTLIIVFLYKDEFADF